MTDFTLVRHGQSDWNNKNLFTGWENPCLTQKGIDEAMHAGDLIKELDIKFDWMFTSALTRAQLTGSIILEKINQTDIDIIKDEALNERFYGDLQGLNKDECRQKWGDDMVQIWRRSYDQGPPGGESLKNTAERVLPYFETEIMPKVKDGLNILIAAHGNSLRALVMEIESISSEDIVKLEIAKGDPLTYECSEGKIKRTN